jgi:glutamine phosphoribosylpyrophosphate amidotransferase
VIKFLSEVLKGKSYNTSSFMKNYYIDFTFIHPESRARNNHKEMKFGLRRNFQRFKILKY